MNFSSSIVLDEAIVISVTDSLMDILVKATAVLVLGVLMVSVMKQRRLSAAARHLVLILTMAAVLAIPLISWTLPVLRVLPEWASVTSIGDVQTEFLAVPSDPKRASLMAIGASETGSHESHAVSIADPWPSRSFQSKRSPWLLVGLPIWFAGVLLALTPTFVGLVSLMRLRRGSRVIRSGPLIDILIQWQSQIRHGGSVELCLSKERWMPMTWGIFRPKLLLPEMALEWPVQRQNTVILHELAHIQRGDFLTTLITRIASAIYWFHPLVWFVARQVGLEQEQACDDAVLAAGAPAEDYAEDVLQIATSRPAVGWEKFGAVAMARPSSLEGRLLAILDDRNARFAVTRATVRLAGIVVTLLIALLAVLRATPVASASRSDPARTPDGLIAWWRGERNGRDSAGDHDGAFPFGERFVKGLSGDAFDFRRSYAIEHQLQRLSIPDSPDFQLSEALTLEAWIFPFETDGIVFHRGDDRAGYDAWEIDLMRTGNISFSFNSIDNQSAGVSAPVQRFQWQHIMATFDRGSMCLYINGVLSAQTQTSIRPISRLEPAAHPSIGIGNVGGKFYSMPFNGFIDEVRIYNRALSADEVVKRFGE